MPKICSNLYTLQEHVKNLNEAIESYIDQEKELQWIIDNLGTSWDSEAGRSYIDCFRMKKRMLELNRETMEDIAVVVNNRYKGLDYIRKNKNRELGGLSDGYGIQR